MSRKVCHFAKSSSSPLADIEMSPPLWMNCHQLHYSLLLSWWSLIDCLLITIITASWSLLSKLDRSQNVKVPTLIDCFSDESLKKAIVGAGKASTVHWEMILIIILMVMVMWLVMVMISDGFDDKMNHLQPQSVSLEHSGHRRRCYGRRS